MYLRAQPDIKGEPLLARQQGHEWDRAHRRATNGLDVILPEQGHQ
jgi:hypothetical protein